MFANSGNSVSRTSIEEANKHLQALHIRVQELENMVEKQKIAIAEKDAHVHNKLQELTQKKDVQMKELKDKLDHSLCEIQRLSNVCSEKDKQIEYLKQRDSILQKLLRSKPAIENVLTILSGVDTAAPPHYYSKHGMEDGHTSVTNHLPVNVDGAKPEVGVSPTATPKLRLMNSNTDSTVNSGTATSGSENSDIDTSPTRRITTKLPREYMKAGGRVSPTIQQLAQSFNSSTRSRHFSISEDEAMDDAVQEGETHLMPGKELYL